MRDVEAADDTEVGSSTGAGASSSSAAADDKPLAIHFRALEEADVPIIQQLQAALFPVQYPEAFYTRLFTPGYYCQVGVTPDGVIVTVASARVVDYNNNAASSDGDVGREAYIMTLGVREGYRQRKLGSRAMEQILKILARQTKAEYAALHVKAANRAAVKFYEALGWECNPVDGYLPSHYYIDGRNWDAYRYTRSLRSPISVMLRDLGCALL